MRGLELARDTQDTQIFIGLTRLIASSLLHLEALCNREALFANANYELLGRFA